MPNYPTNEKGTGLVAKTSLAPADLLIISDPADAVPGKAKAIRKDNAISDAGLTMADITTNNVSTLMHGFAPKLPGNTVDFLRGDGTWATPPGQTATNASTTVKGIVQEATLADVLAGTGTGSTGARLFISPSTMVSAYPLNSFYTYGETITAGQPVYQKDSDGKVYKASSAARDEKYFNYVGIATVSGVLNDVNPVQKTGVNTVQSFGNEQTVIAEAIDQQQATQTNDSKRIFNNTNPGVAVVAQYFTTGNNIGNITAIDVFVSTKVLAGAGDLTLNLYEVQTGSMNATNQAGWGSSLGAVTIVGGALAIGAFNKFIFSSPIVLKPRTTYMWAMYASAGDSNNYYTLGITNSATTYARGRSWVFTYTATQDVQPGRNTDTSNAITFQTYYTVQQNWTHGDYIYLNDTAGTLGVVEGTNQKAIGKIISSTSMIVEEPSSDMDSNLITFQRFTSGSNTLTVPTPDIFIPANTRKIVIEYNHIQGTSGGYNVYVELFRDVRNSMSVSDGSNGNSLAYVWTGNILTIPLVGSLGAGDTCHQNIYYYK